MNTQHGGGGVVSDNNNNENKMAFFSVLHDDTVRVLGSSRGYTLFLRIQNDSTLFHTLCDYDKQFSTRFYSSTYSMWRSVRKSFYALAWALFDQQEWTTRLCSLSSSLGTASHERHQCLNDLDIMMHSAADL